MIIYSDKTKQKYSTVEECEKAEQEYDAALALKEQKKKELVEAKKARANEVVEAYKAVKDAERAYIEKRNAFVKDYGYFHMSFRDENDASFSDLFSLFRIF